MGSPDTPGGRRDALNDWAGKYIQAEVRKHFDASHTILDVGAGWGKYHILLPEYVMDACEVWGPYIEDEQLDEMYRAVYQADICDLNFTHYDIIIFGDVFEHIERDRAKAMLDNIWDRCKQLYIAVPYLYKQEMVHGNPYEVHQQADLTASLMSEQYPMLKLLAQKDGKGVYAKA